MISKSALWMFAVAAFWAAQAYFEWPHGMQIFQVASAGFAFGAACIMSFVDFMLWRVGLR